MGFVVRLHDAAADVPKLIGRVFTAEDALTLMRRWREDHPDCWVEVVAPSRRTPFPEAA